jgi:cytoskeleton protein RodZ
MTSAQAGAAAPAPEGKESVGAALARAREAAGLSLEEAARQLRFAPRQLDALERGALDRLPGGAAVRGMVRSYARLLRIDAEPLVAQLAAGALAQDAERLAQRFRQPVPFSDGSRRSNLTYIALSLGLLAVVAAVAFEWRQERDAARLSFVAAAQQPAEPVRVAAASAAAPTPAPAPAAPAPEAARPAPAQPEPARAPSAAAVGVEGEGGRGRIVLQFEQESWVEIHSGSGKLLVSQLHAPGAERVVSGVPPFAVVIGNAQHVRLSYNDKPVDLIPHVKVEVARLTLE